LPTPRGQLRTGSRDVVRCGYEGKERKGYNQHTTAKKAQIRKGREERKGREGEIETLSSLLLCKGRLGLAKRNEEKEKQKQRKEGKGREGKRGREEERLGRKKKLKTQISLGRPHVTSSHIHPYDFIHHIFSSIHLYVVVACDDAAY